MKNSIKIILCVMALLCMQMAFSFTYGTPRNNLFSVDSNLNYINYTPYNWTYVNLNGILTNITINSSPSLNNITENLSFMIWYNTNNTGKDQFIVNYDWSNINAYLLHIKTTNQIEIIGKNFTTSATSGGNSITPNNWNMEQFITVPTGIQIYNNNTFSSQASLLNRSWNTSKNITIGSSITSL